MSEAASLALPPPLAARPSPAWTVVRYVGYALFLAALFVPGTYYAGDKYWLSQSTRYMALALFALSVDLVWGYTGLLSLGQGLYFGLGAYAVGYSLKLRSAALEVDKPFTPGPDMALPDFMEYCRLPAVPGWIQPLIDIRLALVLALVVPALVAALFGTFTFWRRIKGVYFSLITQALLLAMFLLITTQQPYTGGVVGMTKLAKLELFGHKFVGLHMYYLITGTLVVCFLGCLALVQSKFGRILTAIRDSEYRVLALGYNTAAYKTFIFALAGAIAGLAGALYVSAIGTAGPDRFNIPTSIEVVILVAVGGRGTLVGPVLGALLVTWANTYLNDENLKAWFTLLVLASVSAGSFAGLALARRLRGVKGLIAGGTVGVILTGAAYKLLPLVLPALVRFFRDTEFSYKDEPAWPILLGALFILVVVFLRQGIVGGLFLPVRPGSPRPVCARKGRGLTWDFNRKSSRKRSSRSRKSPSPSAASRPSPISISPWSATSCAWSSGPTAPARRRCSTSSPARPGRAPGGSGFSPTSRRRIDVTGLAEQRIARLGIGRKFQTPNVFKSLSVLENLRAVARSIRAACWRRWPPRSGRTGISAPRRSCKPSAWAPRPTAMPAPWRTAKSNGSSWACSWPRTRSCCWSTSRSPA